MADQYINNMSVTWNDGGTTFAGIKKNVTDTASASDSKLLDLLVGGVSKFYVGKAGGSFASDESVFYDPADPTKRVRLDAGAVTAGQTRVLTLPDRDFDLGKVGWEVISVVDPVAAAAVAFTDLSAYRMIRFAGFLRPVNDGPSLWLRTSTNNGSSYDSTSGDYYHASLSSTTSAATSSGNESNAQSVNLGPSVGNAGGSGIEISALLSEFNQSAHMRGLSQGSLVNNSGNLVTINTAFKRTSGTARNAFRLEFSSGNIAAGHLVVEGMR